MQSATHTPEPRRTVGRQVLLAAVAVLLAAGGGVALTLLGSSGDGLGAVASGSPEHACPVTIPEEPFAPPPPAAPAPSGFGDRSAWYGTAGLWTALPESGLRLSAGGDKTFWWSERSDYQREPNPQITVTATLHGASGEAVASAVPATHGWAETGTPFMLAAIDIPEAGCWELRAEHRGQVLELVVEVVER